MADSTSPQRPLTLSSAKWSALVSPMFKMPMGIFLSLAASRNLYPEYTLGGEGEGSRGDTVQCKSNYIILWHIFALLTGFTCNEEPTTSTASDSASLSCTRCTVCLLTVSPKNVTSGFRMPPQSWQEGTLNWSTCSSSKKTSPSGATPPICTLQSGFIALNRVWRSSLAEMVPQPRHITLKNPPKNTVTVEALKTFHITLLKLTTNKLPAKQQGCYTN